MGGTERGVVEVGGDHHDPVQDRSVEQSPEFLVQVHGGSVTEMRRHERSRGSAYPRDRRMNPIIPTTMRTTRDPTATTKQIQVWMWGTPGAISPRSPSLT